MSRLCKKPIIIPDGIEVSFKDGIFSVKGKDGSLTREISERVVLEVKGKEIFISPKDKELDNAMSGTFASHVKNMILGVSRSFEKKLLIEGVGFKADVKGNEMILNIGFSHPVKVEIPSGLKVVSDKNGISISGPDIELVGQFSALIRAKKKPEPYKGKGIRYFDEVIRRKQGKKAV